MTTRFRSGVYLALATAGISGLAVFLNKFAVNQVASPVVYTTLKNGLVALVLVGLALALGRRREIAQLSGIRKLQLLAVGLVGGAIPFALFFSGLKMTGAVNAALIHKTLFVWVILLAIPFLKEKIVAWQWLGAGAIFAGNLAIGGFRGFDYGWGELMILAATLLWAVENIIAKKALADVSALTLATARLGIGSLALLPFALASGGLTMVAGLSVAAWGWTLLAVGLLVGYVLTWYSALKRAPAGLVATLLVPATLVTNLLSATFVEHTLTWRLALATLLFVGGVTAMVRWAKPKEAASASQAA